MFRVNNKDTRTTPSSASIVNFKHASAGWVKIECVENQSTLEGFNSFLVKDHLQMI